MGPQNVTVAGCPTPSLFMGALGLIDGIADEQTMCPQEHKMRIQSFAVLG